MSTKRARIFLAGAVLAGFLLGVNAGDKGRDRLTEAAAATLERHFPGTEMADIDEREKDDERIFVVKLHEGPKKRDVLVEVTRQGQILEIDEDVATEQLPEQVRRAVKKAFPRGEVKHAEMETHMEITYRVDIAEGERKRRVKLSRRGRIFEIERRD